MYYCNAVGQCVPVYQYASVHTLRLINKLLKCVGCRQTKFQPLYFIQSISFFRGPKGAFQQEKIVAVWEARVWVKLTDFFV